MLARLRASYLTPDFTEWGNRLEEVQTLTIPSQSIYMPASYGSITVDCVLPCEVGWAPQVWGAWESGPPLEGAKLDPRYLEQSWTPSEFLHQPSGLDCRWPLSFYLPPGAETSWPLEVRETGDDVWEGSEVCVLTLTRVCAVIALRLCFHFAVRVGNTPLLFWKSCVKSSCPSDLCRGSETGDDGCLNSLLWFFRIWVASVVLVIKVWVGEGGIFLYPSRS